MQESVDTPLGAALAPAAAADEYEARIVGRYDTTDQLVSWNGEFDDPNLGAPLCTYHNKTGWSQCTVPGETNCSLYNWNGYPGRSYTCDYDAG